MTLDMLNVMLAVGEEGMIDEMLLALLAAPQLAVFFEKFQIGRASCRERV